MFTAYSKLWMPRKRRIESLALLGRSMVNVVAVASELGYLTIPEGMLIEKDEIMRMDPENVVILCTGSQGEPMAALSRLSSSNFRQVEVSGGYGYFCLISHSGK